MGKKEENRIRKQRWVWESCKAKTADAENLSNNKNCENTQQLIGYLWSQKLNCSLRLMTLQLKLWNCFMCIVYVLYVLFYMSLCIGVPMTTPHFIILYNGESGVGDLPSFTMSNMQLRLWIIFWFQNLLKLTDRTEFLKWRLIWGF